MFERFTERARQVVVLAQDASRTLDHDVIDTEHLLLGLIGEEEGAAARALAEAGLTCDQVRRHLADVRPATGTGPAASRPFTPQAKKVLERSLREALALGHNYIGTEHLLLALLEPRDSGAAAALAAFGVDCDHVGGRVLSLIGRKNSPSEPERAGHDELIRVLAELGYDVRSGEHGAELRAEDHLITFADDGQVQLTEPPTMPSQLTDALENIADVHHTLDVLRHWAERGRHLEHAIHRHRLAGGGPDADRRLYDDAVQDFDDDLPF